MPRLSDSMEEGTIIRWLKEQGAQVARGEELVEHKEFGDIPAVCVMDAGNNGVIILADKMLPPRKHGVLIPGPQNHWFKLGFEKYFLWKMRQGKITVSNSTDWATTVSPERKETLAWVMRARCCAISRTTWSLRAGS